MTSKQKKLLEKLPMNAYNLSKTAKEVGYSESYATSGIYQDIRKPKSALREYFTEETVKKDIKKVKRLVLKKQDYTNFLRATELESKILGMQIDKSENKNFNINEEKKVELENYYEALTKKRNLC